MTIENYIAIAIGLLELVCGPLLVRHREKVFHFFNDAQRALGGRVGRVTAKGSSPSMMRFLGVVLTMMGVVTIGAGIFGREP
ncbi:hypothetical protein [uncultured Microbacterium sp.]|uniref:hypothetical protein n=1 Tax=uncultured Microbacterium sp. TaxID=191216 RepID=UPI0028DCAC50|nr:hypothetical protein [uncultured Microbacterium sp.]